MYIYDEQEIHVAETKANNTNRLEEFLGTGPQQVQFLYKARLQNMLAEAKSNSLMNCQNPEIVEKRSRILQYRRRGACKKFELPESGGEQISCILWDGQYYITGTDIIKVIIYKLHLKNIFITKDMIKKFEEGVFSDLRYLKPGVGARLEEARSDFLAWLCRHGCIRTQKKQKVYLWDQVDFEKLVKDARDRLYKNNEAIELDMQKAKTLPNAISEPRLLGLEDMIINDSMESLNDVLLTSQSDFYEFSDSLGYQINEFQDHLQEGINTPSNISQDSGDFMDLGEFNMFGADLMATQSLDEDVADSNQISILDVLKTYTPPPNVREALQASQSGLMENPLTSNACIPILPAGPLPSQGTHRVIPYCGSLFRQFRRDDDRRFVCSYQFCKRRFKRLEHLKRHMRIHTGERPFTCPVQACSKSFSRSDNLAQHLKIHMQNEFSPATTESIGIFQNFHPQQHQVEPPQQQMNHSMSGLHF